MSKNYLYIEEENHAYVTNGIDKICQSSNLLFSTLVTIPF